MARLEFSRREIVDLARKLDSPELHLSQHERALLLAIFSAASEQVTPEREKAPGEAEILADLREALLRAFVPEDAAEYTIGFISAPIISPPKNHH